MAECVKLAILFGNGVTFYGFLAIHYLKAVCAVGKLLTMESVSGIPFDGFLCCGKGILAIVVSKDQCIILGRLPTDRTCSGTSGIPGRSRG